MKKYIIILIAIATTLVLLTPYIITKRYSVVYTTPKISQFDRVESEYLLLKEKMEQLKNEEKLYSVDLDLVLSKTDFSIFYNPDGTLRKEVESYLSKNKTQKIDIEELKKLLDEGLLIKELSAEIVNATEKEVTSTSNSDIELPVTQPEQNAIEQIPSVDPIPKETTPSTNTTEQKKEPAPPAPTPPNGGTEEIEELTIEELLQKQSTQKQGGN